MCSGATLINKRSLGPERNVVGVPDENGNSHDGRVTAERRRTDCREIEKTCDATRAGRHLSYADARATVLTRRREIREIDRDTRARARN